MRDGDYLLVQRNPLFGWEGWYSIDHRDVHGEQVAYMAAPNAESVHAYADSHGIMYDGEGLA